MPKFTLSENTDITDPYYNKDVWCRMTIPTVPGTYNYEVYDDGFVNVKMVAILEGKRPDDDEWKLIGNVGVDSGLIGIFDNKPDMTVDEWVKFAGHLDNDGYSVWAINFGTGDGVFCSSGYGDGSYPVYGVKNEDGKYFAISIQLV